MIALLLLTLPLAAQEGACQMQSAHASYEEGKLCLTGGVRLHHPLGFAPSHPGHFFDAHGANP